MYDIMLNDVCVGTAKMEKEGLYYRICCCCRPPARGIYRVLAINGKDTRDLGICVPSGADFTLTVRIPVKQLQGGPLRFTLVDGKAMNNDFAVPVKNGEPFPHLDKLESARLQSADGQSVIIID